MYCIEIPTYIEISITLTKNNMEKSGYSGILRMDIPYAEMRSVDFAQKLLIMRMLFLKMTMTAVCRHTKNG